MWTAEEVAFLQRYPDATAAELAQLLGCSPEAVRHARSRFGRFATPASELKRSMCHECMEAPVWADSPWAVERGLCKRCACLLREREAADEVLHNRVRQKEHRLRARKRGGGGR